MPVGGGRARPSTCTPSTARLEDAAGPAGPGRASRRRAERSSRRGRRAGGQAPRRSEIRRPGPKAPGTPAKHTKYRPMGGRRNPAGVKGAGGQSCGARGWRQGLAGLRDDAPSRRLAARTASGRAGPAAVGDQAEPQAPSAPRPGKPPLLSADAGFWASRVVDEARHVALEEGGDGRGRARAVLGDDNVGLAGAIFLVVVVGAV